MQGKEMKECKYCRKEPSGVSSLGGEIDIATRNICLRKRHEDMKRIVHRELVEEELEEEEFTDECPVAGKARWLACPFYFPNVPLPRTMDEAVDLLLSVLPEDTKEKIKNSPKGNLGHFGLGMYIRNEFGLWKDNKELLDVCGTQHVDDASDVIIQALWEKLRVGGDESLSGRPGRAFLGGNRRFGGPAGHLYRRCTKLLRVIWGFQEPVNN